MSEVSTASTTAHTEENHVDESPRGIAVTVVVGVLVGLLSGLFGIGGGTIIVPALVWLGLTQRHAAATSMLAIVPTSVSGVLAYAVEGNVDWIAALLMFWACSSAVRLVRCCCPDCRKSCCAGRSWCLWRLSS